MTVSEAARVMGCSPQLVYRLCAGGRLRHRRIGYGRGLIRLERADLDEYLAACEVPPHEFDGGPAAAPRRTRHAVPDWVPPERR